MLGRWTHRARTPLAALATLAALAAPTVRAEDSLADPERIETARDPRRLTSNVRVTASVAKRRFDQLEPIRLAVHAENVSIADEGLPMSALPPEGHYRAFPIRVFDAQGRLLPRTRYQEIDVPSRGMPIGVSNGSAGLYFGPGYERRGEVVANLVYDMSSPGVYTIHVEFRVLGAATIDGQRVPIVAQSEPIEVEVVAEPIRLIP